MKKIIKKNNKFYEIQEQLLDKEALEERRTLLQGRIQGIQDQIDEIDNLLK